MAFAIDINSAPAEQRRQIYAYIRDNVKDYTINNRELEYLPINHIKEIATLENIEAVIAKDTALANTYFPSHSREFLANKIFKEGKKLFVGSMYHGLSMYFVMKLANIINDARLPLANIINIDPAMQADLTKFVATQAMFCAPIFTEGEYDQRASTPHALPLTSLVESGVTATGGFVYLVTFHREHLRSQSTRLIFLMAVFDSKENAEKDTCWLRRHFGFWCASEYFLCYT
jgi:hypothetical protein